MSDDRVDLIFEIAERSVRQIIDKMKPKNLTPIFTGLTAENEIIVMPTRFRDAAEKRAMMELVRKEFAARGVVAYAQHGEIWHSPSLTVAPGEPANVLPSQMPDCEERLAIGATDGTVSRFARYFMDRDETGRIVAIRPDYSTPTASGQWFGTTAEMLTARA